MKNLLFITLLAIFYNANAQYYFTYKTKGDSCLNANLYKRALVNYEKALQTGIYPNNRIFYLSACCWAEQGNIDSAFIRLNNAVDKFWLSPRMEAYDMLKPLHSDKRWQPLVEKINSKCDSIQKIWTKEIGKEIKLRYGTYQEYWDTLPDLEKKYGKGSKEYQVCDKRADDLIKKDTEYLLKIVKRVGFAPQPCINYIIGGGLIGYIQHSNEY